MNHYTQDEIVEYLDGESSPELESLIKLHLDDCPICSEIALRHSSYSNLIRHSQFKESDEFVSESMTKLDNRRFKNVHYKKPISVWEVVVPSLSLAVSVFLLVARPFYVTAESQVTTSTLLFSPFEEPESKEPFNFSNLLPER